MVEPKLIYRSTLSQSDRTHENLVKPNWTHDVSSVNISTMKLGPLGTGSVNEVVNMSVIEVLGIKLDIGCWINQDSFKQIPIRKLLRSVKR